MTSLVGVLGGSMMALAGAMAMPAAAQVLLQEQEVIVRDIRLSDIADLPANHSDRIVARIPDGALRLELSAQAIIDLLRRQAPGIALQPRQPGALSFVLGNSARSDNYPVEECRLLDRPVAHGAFITSAMLSSGPCETLSKAAALITFDRGLKALVAAQDLPAGTNLGHLDLGDAAAPVPAATRMRMQIRSGPVVVEREVRTLQATRAGDRAFVTTAEGDVLIARMAHEEIAP